MKQFLAIIGLFIASSAFGAVHKDTIDTVTVANLGQYGFWINDGWKFHPGDDPAFAGVNYDDHSWQPFTPWERIANMPLTARQGMGWLRVKVYVSTAAWQSTSLRLLNNVAAEVYVDGQLLERRGTINTLTKTGRAFSDIYSRLAIALPISNKTEHVIAIRYAWQPGFIFYDVNNYPGPVLLALEFDKTSRFDGYARASRDFEFSDLVSASILFLLAIFHLTFYRYNHKNRGNLYFACNTLFFGICIFIYFYQNFPNYIDVWIVSGWIGNLAGVAGVLFGAKALFTLFNFKAGRGFTVVIILATLLVVSVNVFSWMPKIIFTYLAIFIVAIQLWLAVRAFWQKKRGAYIIALGFFAATLGVTVYLLAYAQIISVTFIISLIASSVAVLGSTFGISIYLAREFALDSLLLQDKLTQVEELSAKTIAQEQEKQVMLAGQNEILEQQVKERTADLSESLNTLKATQNQLIQSEKMASLGELTAGIAHEIQNPLNFVNNFSEVNTELISEMKQEIGKGDLEEIKAIAEDIEENSKRINMHGKRADAIVKGMLQHSQWGSGVKELTDINKLADEYLRLAYNSLRAKDKGFDAELVTSFDENLPAIDVVQQDIGRVLLNLFNNAFYAVNQKAKTAGEDYKPQVAITTELYAPPSRGRRVVVKVLDNGVGIPDNIKEKIMQPFFTTKPTGEGTGLGLSLTYDMVVKGHGGSIKVESTEGLGSEFIINLPLNSQ